MCYSSLAKAIQLLCQGQELTAKMHHDQQGDTLCSTVYRECVYDYLDTYISPNPTLSVKPGRLQPSTLTRSSSPVLFLVVSIVSWCFLCLAMICLGLGLVFFFRVETPRSAGDADPAFRQDWVLRYHQW